MSRKAPPPSPRIAKSPVFKEEGLTSHLDRMSADLSRELQSRVVRTEALDSILLMSPIGKVFKVTVDDAGVLITVEVAS